MIKGWSWVAGSGSSPGGGNAFGIIQPPNGTSPTASTTSDTLNLTSSGGTITITGNSGSKTINYDVAANTSNQQVQVAKNSGAVVGTRHQLNFIEGSNVTLTVADDAGGDRVNVTIASSGGASGYSTIQEEGVSVTQRSTMNFIGSGITAADDAGNTRTNITLDTILNNIQALASTGLIARTGSGTVAVRTITGTATEIAVTNGDGVSGNPTISLPASIDLSGKTSLKIPVSAAPSISANGEIGVDTTVTDFTPGVLKYYSGEEVGVVAMPIAQFTSPVDGYVPTYDATADEFQLKVLPTKYGTIQEEGTPLTQRATMNFIGTGITAADDAGNTRTNITLSTILNAVNDLSSTGLIARTGAGTVSVRTITGTANRITVTNGDGVSGNPTLDVGTNVTVLGNTTTGSGSIVLATTPTLVTPVLGVATATSVNGLIITTTTGTLTMTNAKTLAVTNSLTLSGTDSTVMTFPSTSQTVAGLTSTQTFTNKRITKRVVTVSDATSITPDIDASDIVLQANTQAVGTLTMNAPTGTPTDGQPLVIRLKSTNVQTFSWNAAYRGSTTTALPTTSTGATKTDYFCFIYNLADTKYDFTGSNKGF